ncbi:hypothetical protein RclHR1_03420013 [Rhizophagus clarus]|uniref:Carbohydrate-binding module family 13 protein n=1 Tax=Rhizophagus clarus TaxID=94130 RepID=A0A2Z6RAW2_9GLOM|nr:hypothetical protein RclHR1_03420013 [Rhizophagus clarus]GES89954.1 carbohydrate-binding module family 13 protein [Rhizophagus clarus]
MDSLPSDKQYTDQIYQNELDCDVIFILDQKPNIKRMFGHSFILKVKSSYFNIAFQCTDKNYELVKNCYQFTFPEYSFEIFNTILKIIYGNDINVSTMDEEFLLNLLKAADRFKLYDDVDYFQSYLIEARSSWIYDNIFKLIAVTFDNDNFHQLKSFVIDLICKDTKWFLGLKQFNDLSENHLIKFLQIDDLFIEEFHVWNAVLGWTFKRNAELKEKNVIRWSDKEIDCFKMTLNPLIPFIRFFQISSFKYWDYIHEFDKVLPEELINEILEYYFKGSLPVNHSLLSLRNVRKIDSDLISSEQAEIISLWIENKIPKKFMGLEWEFKFNLLYSTRRDSCSVKKFHEYCDNKGATIVLVKTEISDEIIGGYNPISWGNYEYIESIDSPRYLPDDDDQMDMEESNNISTDDTFAFIFLFNNKNGKNKLGKFNSTDISYTVHNCYECGPCFGTTDLWITPKEDHSDKHNIAYQPLSNFGYHRQDCYDIELREEPGGFQLVEYEVFQVVHV